MFLVKKYLSVDFVEISPKTAGFHQILLFRIKTHYFNSVKILKTKNTSVILKQTAAEFHQNIFL